MIICPKCGTKYEPSSEECGKCGIVFEKYKRSLLNNALSAFKKNNLYYARELFEKIATDYPELSKEADKYIRKIHETNRERLFNKAINAFKENNLNHAKEMFEVISVDYPELDEEANRYIKIIHARIKKKYGRIKKAYGGMSENVAIYALKIFAGINLLGGIIGTIFVWNMIGIFDVPAKILLGFALLCEGIFGSALLLVICSIAENLIEIRKNTNKIKF